MFLDKRTGIPPGFGAGNPPVGAGFSRFNFVEEKNYHQMLKLQGKPYNEDEVNELQARILHKLRRHVFDFMGDGSTRENLGFQIVGDGSANDFTIKGGAQPHPTGDSLRDAGRIFLDGFQIVLHVATATRTTFDQQIADIKYSDLLADVPARAPDGALSTPVGADRLDEVFLEFQMDEITNADDPDLQNPDIGINTVRMVAMDWKIRVAEGGTTPETEFDAVNKLWKYRLKLAELDRKDGQAAINANEVTDFRLNRWWKEHGPSGEHLLNVPGYTFQFFQNIVRAAGVGLDANFDIEYDYDATSGLLLRWKMTDDGVLAVNFKGEGSYTYDSENNLTQAVSYFADTFGLEAQNAIKVTDDFVYSGVPKNLVSQSRVSIFEAHTFFQPPFDF
jgi:hypothetical protein